MKTLRLLLIFTAIGLLTDCTSGKKALKHGNYFQAVMRSVKRLQHNPNHKKSKIILDDAYDYALQQYEDDAQNILASNSQFKFCDALDKYDMINQMYDAIRKSPGALAVIPRPVNYHGKADELKTLAAGELYLAAESALARNSRQDAKDAYYYYEQANDYVPGYKDALQKMEEALFRATLKVAVEQIPVPTSYTLSSSFFQDQVASYLHDKYYTNKFVKFYNEEEADAVGWNNMDQFMRIVFDDFKVGQTFISKNTETFTKDSVVVGSVTLEDGTVVNAYNTVSATLKTWHKETISEGLLSMEIYDAQSNAMLKHERFDGQFVWVSEWGSYNGDKRALTPAQLAICDRIEAVPPPPQQLFMEFTRPIYDQLTNAVSRYYSRF